MSAVTSCVFALTPAQQELADAMSALVTAGEQRFTEALARFNGSTAVETRTFDDDKAFYQVSVGRGPVLEKAAWMINYTKKAQPPYVPEPLWQRYMELDFHPCTPLVGQLHATVYFTYNADGSSAIAGYMDYTPGAWIEEDIAALRASVDEACKRHGQDVARYREMLQKDYHRLKLRAACVGAAFYVRPMLEVTPANFRFVSEAHDAFVEAYLAILEKRRDETFSAFQLRDQEDMRRRWLEDHLFSDPFTMYVVPYEVWSFAGS